MSDNKKYCVYKHESPSGKVYIGVTSLRPERRWENGHGYSYNPHFWKAIVKYGWENFTHTILFDDLSKDEAYSLEIELIREYNSTNPKRGYNITNGGKGGQLGIVLSEEQRKKKSESAKKAWERIPYKQRSHYREEKDLKPATLRYRGARLGHKKTPVVQLSINGEYIRTWNSMCEIERKLGIKTGKISECCHGKRPAYGGYKWLFAEVELYG